MVTAAPPAAVRRLTAAGPWALEGLLLAAVAGAGLFDLAVTLQLGGGDRTPVAVRSVAAFAATAGGLTCVGVRRRAPVAAVAGAVALCAAVAVAFRSGTVDDRLRFAAFGIDIVPLAAPVVALGFVLGPVVRRAPARVAAGASAASVLVVGAVLTLPMDDLVRLVYVLAFTAVLGLALGTGGYLRALDARGAAAAERARLDERTDIARELHDLVAHHVAGIVVQAQAARVVADREPAAAAAALERIEHAGRDALGAMRDLVRALRQAEADVAPTAPPVGLAGLDDLARAGGRSGVAVDLRVEPGLGDRLPGAVAAAVHRIVQESLTNVGRHADGATAAVVEVHQDGSLVVVDVTDDGRADPLRPDAGTDGFGIVGMAERAAALGGSLAAGPLDPPARGWRVRATLPIAGEGP